MAKCVFSRALGNGLFYLVIEYRLWRRGGLDGHLRHDDCLHSLFYNMYRGINLLMKCLCGQRDGFIIPIDRIS